jgi:mRNA-degrading endonuclease RelE of RelBE toxin-antitoxin system
MKKGYTVYVSDEARREHEKLPKKARRKKDCPSCEVKTGTCHVSEKIEEPKTNKEGDK